MDHLSSVFVKKIILPDRSATGEEGGGNRGTRFQNGEGRLERIAPDRFSWFGPKKRTGYGPASGGSIWKIGRTQNTGFPRVAKGGGKIEDIGDGDTWV